MKPHQTSARISSSTWLVIGLVVLFFVGSYGGRQWLSLRHDSVHLNDEVVESGDMPTRIVGLAPSTVESLFALGLGDRVVGISRYSSYPPEALDLPKIAGFVDIDYERLVSLEPDCVVMVDSQQSLEEKLHQLGLKTVTVKHATVDGILESFAIIGKACGKEVEAAAKVDAMKAHLEETEKRMLGKSRPRVLVCIDRDPDSPRPDRVIAAGSGGFHRELITLAGGVNAYQGSIAYPVLSREKLLNLNPDVIIDLVRDETFEKYKEPVLLKQWYAFGELNAVKNKRVVIIAGNQHLIPGPRFLDTLDAMVEAIHPK